MSTHMENSLHCGVEIPGVDLKRQHCGLIAAKEEWVRHLMPDLEELVSTCPRAGYRFDVKVHMLMPGQWPCIPNWHCDFVPRDGSNRLRPEWILDSAPPMFMLLSGPPFTEFRDGRQVEPWEWIRFTQRDEHRGTKAEDFCWRLFVRAVPESLLPPHVHKIAGLRRHSQVYIEPDFKW